MKTDYCAYPPQLAVDVEITKQLDGERTAFIAGSTSAGRYILLRETEHKVLSLFDETRRPAEVCEEFKRLHGASLSLPTLAKFLKKLDEVGLLAGERAQGYGISDAQLSAHFYKRFKIFNPDRLFSVMVPSLRWIWTTGFFVTTILLMIATLLLSLVNSAEVVSYGDYVLREHYVAVFVASWVVVVSHEFGHGLTCKAFGGRTSEVGVLMLYYVLPGMYCNVSGLHLIQQRSRRLWVIAAGIYWQLLVGTISLLSWFALAPHTLLSDLAFFFFLGSVLNIIFNANPLIKLDGYYFLSQLLQLPNLMERSRLYWRGLLKRILFGESIAETARYSMRERSIYATFGVLSFLYTIVLRIIILVFIGNFLIDKFQLLGLLITALMALMFMRRPLGQMISAAKTKMAGLLEVKMANNDQATPQPSTDSKSKWRRRLIPLAIAMLIIAILVMPWSASVGNYGTLIAIPGQETIIRAPEGATLIALDTQPGHQVASGAVIGRMGNFDLEEQIVQVQADLARANAESDRLLGEMRAREEMAARAELQLRQRRHDYDEIDGERRQIERRRIAEAGEWKVQFVSDSARRPNQNERPAVSYPAALAVLQAEVDSCRAQADEANANRDRTRKLHAEGIVPRSELDAAETRMATMANALAAARQRLEASLIEHRRRYVNVATDMKVADSDFSSERLQIAKLNGELSAMRALVATLESRRDLLLRKRAQFELVTQRAGTVFGEDLPRSVGQYFQKGAEICRVADTRELLLRIQVPEREIGDVRDGAGVRLKVPAYPDRVFRGVVSKIGGESEQGQFGQTTYRVELTIDNSNGLLRPGMTAFARVDFDRQMVGRILLHKIKQALRPELWML